MGEQRYHMYRAGARPRVLPSLIARPLSLEARSLGPVRQYPLPSGSAGVVAATPAAATPNSLCGDDAGASPPAVLVSPRRGCAGACGGCVLVPARRPAGRQACTHGGLLPVWVCCSVKTGAGSSLLERMTGRHRMRRREMLADETKSWDCICRVGGGARV